MAQTIGSLDLNAFSGLYNDSTQYFWFESNASATYGAGAHVTLVPDTSFISNPTGQNILMNTDGFSIRNGLLPMMTLDNDSLDFNVVDTTAGTYVTTATFSSTGAQIGQSSGTHLELNANGFSIFNGVLPMMTLDNDSLDFNVINTTAGTYVTTATFGSTGATIGQTNGAHIQISSSGLDVNTDSSTNIASFGINGARIGQSGAAHSVIDADGQRFYASDGSTLLANIGYGEGATQSGTAIAPYYTFGVRRTTTTEYSSSSTYVVGNMCVHNEKVYVCIENITTPESWTSSHWRYYIGNYSHAEGYETIASGMYSHAEGERTTASGMFSHAEGYYTIASVSEAHAEGYGTIASGLYSHAEGGITTASAVYSHAEGCYTIASEGDSHAEGYNTIAKGMHSHAQNLFSVATENSQTVIGKYNSATRSGSGTTADPYTYSDAGDYAFIIGNGTGDATADRSNALTVDWNGGITVQNHSSPIGSIVDGYLTSAKSVPNNTNTMLFSMSLTAGIWLVECGVRFPANGSGLRRANFTTSSAAPDAQMQFPPAPASGVTQYRWTTVAMPTSTTTYYLNCYQNSGSALTMPASGAGYGSYARAIRIL